MTTQLSILETEKRNTLQKIKPYVYEKCLKFDEKLKKGESIAIIQFQYNYVCNFKCVHCSIKRFQHKQDKEQFTIENVKKLSKEADELGLARFVITGGEPLLFKDFDEVVKAIDPQKFYINVDTNGWFLNDEKAKHLKEMWNGNLLKNLQNNHIKGNKSQLKPCLNCSMNDYCEGDCIDDLLGSIVL